MKRALIFLIAILAILPGVALAGPAPAAAKHTFTIGENDFLLDGQRFQIRCGEVHSPRVPREYWRHRLQMAKAMGLNTVCAYLFWNVHEPRPGEFDWKGQNDVAEFCRIAQEEGLWVILRPGPYSCAEWEMGGFPWWLLKNDDIQLRTRDPRYIEAATRYLKEVGRALGSQQVTKGGPILMVQVENEYGFFAKDAEYMGVLRQALLDAGFDVPLFACNPVQHLKDGYRADLFPVVNFGSDPEKGFEALRQILPKGPLMCGEFYPGWFDTWGAPHHMGKTDVYLKDLEYMLKVGGSFSIYMAHGGTSFGFSTGADRPFKPDTSSYDYDAPISEAGWVTEKFTKTRDLMAKYLLPGEKIPDAPAKNPVITIAPVEMEKCLEIIPFLEKLNGVPKPVQDEKPRTMELYDQAYGCIVYRMQLPAGPAATLEAKGVRDIGQVFLDGMRVGFLDRRSGNAKLHLPERKEVARLDIFVEAMGRVNFGIEVHDRKGLLAPVNLTADGKTTELTGWQVFSLPLDDKMIAGLQDTKDLAFYEFRAINKVVEGPTFWRTELNVETPGDTFLDVRAFGKGFVWVNGHNLGRYWNIGPQQTMYVPGPWLKKGKNEVVVLDLLGPGNAAAPKLAGLDTPILNTLRPELDFARSKRPEVSLQLDAAKPVHAASFAPGTEKQEVKFASPAKGRYFCIESLNAHDGQAFAAIAELTLMDEAGKPLSTEGWTVAYVDSEERGKEDGTAENAIDGQTANFWHTEWSAASPNHPHRLVLDMGQTRTVGGLVYVPRQGAGSVGGRIKDYKIYVGDGLVKR
jgi:beta-galactosidase